MPTEREDYEDAFGGPDGADAALNRMKRAYARGTGCHLTPGMIQSLAVSSVGEMWEAPSGFEEDAPHA